MTATTTRAARSQSELDRYLQTLAGANPAGRLVEIRFARGSGGGMGRTFIPARSPGQAAGLIARLAPRTDVYTGVALRHRRAGDRHAIAASHLLFVEIDSREGQDRLVAFSNPPTMLIASGSEGHAHAYWQLRTPIGVDELEQANRRLAHHLGADLASVDAARILRPPQTKNHKHTPPTPVRLISLDLTRRYELGELVEHLSDPPGKPPVARSRPRTVRHPLDRALLAIPAADYVTRLAGLSPNRAGKVRCPFHDDQTPSLQTYQDGSWYCFGCTRGGSIYDFAALLWLTGTKDREFIKLRARLADQLLEVARA